MLVREATGHVGVIGFGQFQRLRAMALEIDQVLDFLEMEPLVLMARLAALM